MEKEHIEGIIWEREHSKKAIRNKVQNTNQ